MFEDFGKDIRRPVSLFLAALAVLGWIVAIGLSASRSDLADRLETATDEAARLEGARSDLAGQLTEQQQASGELANIRSRIAAGGDELAKLDEGRQTAQQEVAALEARLAEIRPQAEARRRDLAQLEGELQQSRQELATNGTQIAEIEKQIPARSQELAEVGQRLETARAQEVQSRATVAQLTAEAARLTVQSSEAEQRIQTARQSEADAEKQVTDAREELIRIDEERRSLEQAVVDLTARKESLTADNAMADERRSAVQAEITTMSETLAARSEEVADLEKRIGELQGQATNLGAAAGLGLQPGRYKAGPVEVTFATDGAFKMQKAGSGRAVTGRYSVEGGVLTLFDAIGDTGTAEFPMACAIQPEAIGFRLTGENDACTVFDEVRFEPQG